MKISVQVAAVLAMVFSLVCFAVAITGFTSLEGITDPAQLSDAKGFAAFWAFLGVVGVAIGAMTWWVVREPRSKDE